MHPSPSILILFHPPHCSACLASTISPLYHHSLSLSLPLTLRPLWPWTKNIKQCLGSFTFSWGLSLNFVSQTGSQHKHINLKYIVDCRELTILFQFWPESCIFSISMHRLGFLEGVPEWIFWRVECEILVCVLYRIFLPHWSITFHFGKECF